MDKSKAYSILGLSQDAGEDDIKNAYRELAKKYSADSYDSSPLREEATEKMNELNDAFDMVMSIIRADGVDASQPASYTAEQTSSYPAIRQLINTGHVEEALAELQALPATDKNAEWHFLMGSVYYYKGWLDQARRYFSEATRLEPANREYQAALRNLTNSAQGEMPGNPYARTDSGSTALNCACNTCTLMCCMDACCGMCGGG